MVKVIKDGRVKQVTCLNCNSILEYTDNDVLRKYHSAEVGKYEIYYTYNGWQYTITCPICEKDVIVPHEW